jgi:DNA-binding XRE family transcriptional regulator
MYSLYEIRTRKAMSQRDLARLSGVALSTINHIETGKHKASFVTRRKLAMALGIPVEDIEFSKTTDANNET